MDVKMRVFLIIATVFCFYFLIKSVRRGKLRTDYALGWILASLCLIIIGCFPVIVYFVSSILGIISPANAVFMFIIFLLILLVYILFNKVSMLEEKQKDIIQELALLEYKMKEEKKQ